MNSIVVKNENGWTCGLCGYEGRHRNGVILHVDAHHLDTGGYTCQICEKFCPSKNALNAHVSRYHRKKKIDLY